MLLHDEYRRDESDRLPLMQTVLQSTGRTPVPVRLRYGSIGFLKYLFGCIVAGYKGSNTFSIVLSNVDSYIGTASAANFFNELIS